MKHIIAVLYIAAALPAAAGEILTIDSSHSAVILQWNHFGFSNPVARLEKVEGKLDLDQADLSRSSIVVNMPLDALRTGDDFLNKRLLGSEFFDAKRYPVATFRSVLVRRVDAEKLVVEGELSVHGVTRPVLLNARLNRIAPNPFTRLTTVGFEADGVIRRSEFGLDKYIPAVSDEVTVRISVGAEMGAGGEQ